MAESQSFPALARDLPVTLLYRHAAFQQHLTGAHPEHPRRLAAIDKHLASAGLTDRSRQPEWSPASESFLAQLHDPAYVAQVSQYASAGGGRMEADTVLSERSFEVACLAGG